jgi:hypothetical protein
MTWPRPRASGRRRASRLRLAAFAGLVALTLFAVGLALASASHNPFAVDAHVYWSAWQHGGLYTPGATLWQADYLYSPAFAQAFWPLTTLPWPVFAVLWTGAALVVYTWLLWPLDLPLRIAALAFLCAGVLPAGNIEWLLALVAVGATRYPAAWALPLLTKVTPGVGVLWYAARGEWRAFATAVAVAAAIVLVSFAVAPSLWFGWVSVLTSHHPAAILGVVPEPGPLVRTLLAVLLVLWGARTDRAWVLPASMALAQPDIGLGVLALFAAVPRLIVRPLPDRGTVGTGDAAVVAA